MTGFLPLRRGRSVVERFWSLSNAGSGVMVDGDGFVKQT
jgi:hypothetical protein